MNVTSVTQDDFGMLTIFFDIPGSKITLGNPFGNERYDLNFMLQAAQQTFNGIAPFYVSPEQPPPTDVLNRTGQLVELIVSVYHLPPDHKKSLMN